MEKREPTESQGVKFGCLARTEQRSRPQIVDLDLPFFDIRGVTVPIQANNEDLNEDTFSLATDREGVTLTLIDNVLIHNNLSVLTRDSRKADRMSEAGQADILERRAVFVSRDKSNSERVDTPFIWMKLEPKPESGDVEVQYVGQSDCFLLAFVPRKSGGCDLRIIYSLPDAGINRGNSGKQIFPTGSIFFAATDGALTRALASFEFRDWYLGQVVRSDAHLEKWEKEKEEKAGFFDALGKWSNWQRQTSSAVISNADEEKILGTLLGDLADGLVVRDNFPMISRRVIEYFKDFEKQKKRGNIVDDTTFFIIGTHKKSEKLSYPEELRPLVKLLSAPNLLLNPSRTPDIIKKYGTEIVAGLVGEAIKRGETGGLFFARACALTKFEELSEEAKKWFEKEGLVVLDDFDFEVYPMHFNEPKSEGICNDIGFASFPDSIVDLDNKQLDWRDILDSLTKRVRLGEIHFFDREENYPEGVWGEARHTGGQRFTIPGTYITSKDGRGILVPTVVSGGIYLHDPDFHTKRNGRLYLYSSVVEYTWKACIAWSHFMRHPESKGDLIKRGGTEVPANIALKMLNLERQFLATYLEEHAKADDDRDFKILFKAEKRLKKFGWVISHTLQGVRIVKK